MFSNKNQEQFIRFCETFGEFDPYNKCWATFQEEILLDYLFSSYIVFLLTKKIIKNSACFQENSLVLNMHVHLYQEIFPKINFQCSKRFIQYWSPYYHGKQAHLLRIWSFMLDLFILIDIFWVSEKQVWSDKKRIVLYFLDSLKNVILSIRYG